MQRKQWKGNTPIRPMHKMIAVTLHTSNNIPGANHHFHLHHTITVKSFCDAVACCIVVHQPSTLNVVSISHTTPLCLSRKALWCCIGRCMRLLPYIARGIPTFLFMPSPVFLLHRSNWSTWCNLPDAFGPSWMCSSWRCAWLSCAFCWSSQLFWQTTQSRKWVNMSQTTPKNSCTGMNFLHLLHIVTFTQALHAQKSSWIWCIRA